jgi:transcriptional regulator with XRE-family HTH domain
VTASFIHVQQHFLILRLRYPVEASADSYFRIERSHVQQHFTVQAMHRPARSIRARRPETQQFRIALLKARETLGWTQEDLARRLRVSPRTLSNWECGYWLPPYRQRVHVVVGLRDAPPEWVLEAADGLGVGADPAVEPLLRSFRQALGEVEEDEIPAPPPPEPTDEALLAAVDPLVRVLADEMNVAANDLRRAVGRILAASASLHASLAGVERAVAVKPRKPVSEKT